MHGKNLDVIQCRLLQPFMDLKQLLLLLLPAGCGHRAWSRNPFPLLLRVEHGAVFINGCIHCLSVETLIDSLAGGAGVDMVENAVL
ncbi:hypothetical protein FKM82_029055 [Ascaphus truei]